MSGADRPRRCSIRLAALAGLAWLASGPAAAHEVRPGYLEIRETENERYELSWKVPANGEYRLAMYVRLPDNCSGTPTHGRFVGGAYLERWQARCPGGLVGRTIEIDGLASLRTDVLVRVERLDGTLQTERLTAERTGFTPVATPSSLEVAWTYFVLGVEHILLGADHLLFVLALLFIVHDWRRLVATVTAFTVAHSLTLAAATLGFVHVPQSPVEAAIALSVMFVAAEIVQATRGRPSLASRAPWLVAFVFGLLHGLGFAGALREVGLPQRDIPLALLTFNLGVEAGQLLFIAVVIGVLSLLGRVVAPAGAASRGHGPWLAERRLQLPVAYVVGAMAAYWVIDRTVGAWLAV